MEPSEAGDATAVDFWWIKPKKSNGAELETQTLPRQNEGPHKNSPGRSQPVYAPLASLFTASSAQARAPAMEQALAATRAMRSLGGTGNRDGEGHRLWAYDSNTAWARDCAQGR
eukprot:3183275-Prymnesium_polylepis.1